MNFTIRQQRISLRDAATQVLLVGDWTHPEMAAALVRVPGNHEWPRAETLETAEHLLLESPLTPELIFLAHPLPARVSAAQLDRLQKHSPLTRIVLVAGTWCEGELRTGNVPAGVIRLYWYDLANWWLVAQKQLAARIAPAWSQPLDHPQAGRWTSVKGNTQQAAILQIVVIDAADYSVFETLAAALVDYGMNCYWQQASTRTAALPDFGIWDGSQLSLAEQESLSTFCRQVNGPVVALLDFPRLELIEKAQAAGASNVVAKPYLLDELVCSLLTLAVPPWEETTTDLQRR